jgi:hypothetical protein
MSRAGLLKTLAVVAVSVALSGNPESAFGQRGGHGGGGFHGGAGGFHGGGGFGGMRGGSLGGFRGGGFGGFHDGSLGGFRDSRRFFGGFRGYGGFGFGLGFGFGFDPYWGGYPYLYGYGPWWEPYGYYYPYGPYYYPNDPYYDRGHDRDNHCIPDYRHSDDRCNDVPPDASKPNDQATPTKPSSTPAPASSADPNYVVTNFADHRPAASDELMNSVADVARDYQSAESSTRQLNAGIRPALWNVIRALRAMPPDSRQRQISSGRYRSWSPAEREFAIKNASQPPQAD